MSKLLERLKQALDSGDAELAIAMITLIRRLYYESNVKACSCHDVFMNTEIFATLALTVVAFD